MIENQTQPSPEEQFRAETSGSLAQCTQCGSTDVGPGDLRGGGFRCRACEIVLYGSPPEPPPKPLRLAGLDATLNERGARYGDYAKRSVITQGLKDAFRCAGGWENLNPSQRETLDMVASKIARILNGDPNYVDSWHDIAGYATLIEDQLTGKPR